MRDILEKAIEQYKTREFFYRLSESVAKYKSNKDDWQDEVFERKKALG